MKVKPVIKSKEITDYYNSIFTTQKQGGFTNSSNLSNILNNYTH